MKPQQLVPAVAPAGVCGYPFGRASRPLRYRFGSLWSLIRQPAALITCSYRCAVVGCSFVQRPFYFPSTPTQASHADKPRGDPAPVTELVVDGKTERREKKAKGHGVHVGSEPAQHSSPQSVLLEEESSCLPQSPTATQTSSQATPAHADDCNVSLKPVQPSAATAPG